MENAPNGPQHTHPAVAFMLANPALFRRQGVLEAQWRGRGPRRSGPYFRLRFRDAGARRSIYLGCEGPLVQQVRALLARLQAAARRDRQRNQRRQQLTALLRGITVNLSLRLAPLGLRMKGREVRGWRTSRLPR